LVKPRYRKTVPVDLHLRLKDPLSLMVWHLDDGTLRDDCMACRLATQCFTHDEKLILQYTLFKNFNIKSEIENWPEDKDKSSLYIPAKNGNGKDFILLFRDTVLKEIPSMKSKVLHEEKN
jgi:hypothetical protein